MNLRPMFKRLFFVPLCSLVLAAPAFALSGGPFSNDEVASGGDGSYQGTLSGENLIGMVAFGFSRSAVSGGRWAVFHEGFARFGNLSAVVDVPGRTVAGVFATTAITGSAAASGGFMASISRTAPILMFNGDGLYSGPASPRNDVLNTTTTRNSVIVTEVGAGGAVTTETETETQFSNSVTFSEIEQTPFQIHGVRTSLAVGNFSFTNTGTVGTVTP